MLTTVLPHKNDGTPIPKESVVTVGHGSKA